jgi:hypothetical protein
MARVQRVKWLVLIRDVRCEMCLCLVAVLLLCCCLIDNKEGGALQ